MPCLNLKQLSLFQRIWRWATQPNRAADASAMTPAPNAADFAAGAATTVPSEQPDSFVSGDYLYINHAHSALARSEEPSSSDLSLIVAAKLSQISAQQASRSKFRAKLRSHSDIINAESRLGSTIFGPIPEGHRREFFHDKKNIWIWHESWTDEYSQDREVTVRYEIRPTGVYKKYASGAYAKLEDAELYNFRKATHAYLKVIKETIYGPVAATC